MTTPRPCKDYSRAPKSLLSSPQYFAYKSRRMRVNLILIHRAMCCRSQRQRESRAGTQLLIGLSINVSCRYFTISSKGHCSWSLDYKKLPRGIRLQQRRRRCLLPTTRNYPYRHSLTWKPCERFRWRTVSLVELLKMNRHLKHDKETQKTHSVVGKSHKQNNNL